MSKFEKLAADIRRQIQAGQLKPGDRLPSVAKLCEEHGVSYGTVRAAMLILKVEKLIVGRPGDALYVREEVDRILA
ncbi:winged helix-turn-helix domain-containing protein [Allorhizocola rhizosphaerae]|uniref:winged helix-turn-helix domain-containing protein n=1 Tax=Allorhizocola rhizosphaerae TaxID=1872709 RepID=UPI000E3C4900|nr:winged helix-turn-helix domain-containing protein [Allorhizocola rhizosphaerae]